MADGLAGRKWPQPLRSQHDNRREPFNPSSNGMERAQSISTLNKGAIAPASSKAEETDNVMSVGIDRDAPGSFPLMSRLEKATITQRQLKLQSKKKSKRDRQHDNGRSLLGKTAVAAGSGVEFPARYVAARRPLCCCGCHWTDGSLK
ncbi:hypothetical protein VTL71DRAFT_7837 [Oculimacula yallundae]|uniref:Uncharacterized protein n=1 Tax=Oculimacula yallundae TaxID=86028 RepID=A0ABR4CYB6_9HELO